jgi:hypothetical protein
LFQFARLLKGQSKGDDQMKHHDDEGLDQFAQMGLAALLPGMRFMVELVTKAFNEKRDLLTELQSRFPQIALGVGKRRGRPPGIPNKPKVEAVDPVILARKKRGATSWAGMTKEQRSAEMKRRMALAQKRNPSTRMGRGPQQNPAATMQSQWAAMSPAKKRARLAALAAGKAKKARAERKAARQAKAAVAPNGALAVSA